ncbi:MAG: hypothetical protein AAB583_05005 [Patescibacteria group bacterium]
MASPEFRTARFKNLLRVGAAVILSACSSNVGLAMTDEHRLDVGGEASIVRNPNGIFLIVDLPGGLTPESSIAKAKNFMRRRGCDIIDTRSAGGLNGKQTKEFVLVINSCLPELK